MPGVPPSCICGTCRLCKRRAARKRHYRKHAEQVYQRVKEYRETHPRKLQTSVTDEELDRRAVEHWRPEWGQP